MSPRKPPLPNLPMVMTVLTWGFNFVAIKILYESMTAPAVALVRFAAMYAVLILVCKLKGESLRYRREDVLPLMWLGFISMGVYMILFLEGMRGSGAAEGAIILATAPIFTTLFAVLYKQERFSIGALFGAIVAFAGTVVVILGAATVGSGHLVANLMILASAVVWAYGAVLMRPLLEKYSPTQALTMSMPGALALLIPYGATSVIAMDWTRMTTTGWAMLAYISVFAGVVGFLGFYMGVRQIGAGRAMMYQFFVPPTTALCAYLFMHTSMSLQQTMGLVIVIAGVILASWSRMQTAREASQPT